MSSLIRAALHNYTFYPYQDPTGAKSEKIRQRMVARFDEMLQSLATFRLAGSLPKTHYDDLKHGLNQTIEKAWEASFPTLELKNFSNAEKIAIFDATTGYNLQLHTFNAHSKRVAKVPGNYSHKAPMLAFLAELKPIVETMVFLKDRITKREPKPVEDMREKYIAPMASHTAMAQIQAVLLNLTQDAFESIKAQFMVYYNAKVKIYETAIKNAKENGVPVPRISVVFRKTNSYPDADGIAICQLVFDHHGIKDKDADTKILKEVIKSAQTIRDRFVIKNLKKFDSIIEAKKNFVSVEVVGHSLNMGNLTGTLLLKFADGSSFYAKNSVVWGVSKYGRQFNRFPLTFHDVTMPDGSRLSAPSEERMNTVFVKAEAE